MARQKKETRLDKTLDWFKDRPWAVYVLLAFFALTAIGDIAAAVRNIRDLVASREEHAANPPTCRYILAIHRSNPRYPLDQQSRQFVNFHGAMRDIPHDQMMVVALKHFDPGTYQMTVGFKDEPETHDLRAAVLTDAVFYVHGLHHFYYAGSFLKAITENEAIRFLHRFDFAAPDCASLPPGVSWHFGPKVPPDEER